jgi:hypothetical protein
VIISQPGTNSRLIGRHEIRILDKEKKIESNEKTMNPKILLASRK